ncbi:GNAT family N-acetyltransferase [Acidicapsa dinghuensis]|uniref:GNAT family N-acetyltransferase n=1 Tax=Acidicapsa dinghuensis TaxID=2218256 RepID=A0ABW1ELJ9_9BACT|nr:GNAT family N-acetyltransferase [Acidicapsa dinghuensis]
MIVIRECKGFDELQACVDLQIEVWGYNDGDVIPRRVFLVAKKIGGQVIGAFDVKSADDPGDASSMIGFAFGLPGVKTGAESRTGKPEPYLHSHMLAVREGYRNQSIGARLKLAQREDAIARGFERMEWTFDPVEIKNAFLNIHKLGAIVRHYEENFYGVSSSRLQGGLQTDRLVAEWWLLSPRVTAAIQGTQKGPKGFVFEDLHQGLPPKIEVPAAIYAWKADDEQRHLAQKVQAENRLQFQKAFAAGLAVIGFSRDAEGNGTYHLGRWTEPGMRPEVQPASREENGVEADLSRV